MGISADVDGMENRNVSGLSGIDPQFLLTSVQAVFACRLTYALVMFFTVAIT